MITVVNVNPTRGVAIVEGDGLEPGQRYKPEMVIDRVKVASIEVVAVLGNWALATVVMEAEWQHMQPDILIGWQLRRCDAP